MKRSAFLIVIGLVSMLTACQSCKKQVEPTTLPPETQTGANTFACKVNGKVFLPKGRPNIYGNELQVVYDETFEGGHLGVSAYNKDLDASIGFGGSEIDKPNIYTTKADSSNRLIFNYFPNNCSFFSLDNSLSFGILTITKIDKFNRVISGRFEATIYARQPECGKVEITEGRFDLKY